MSSEKHYQRRDLFKAGVAGALAMGLGSRSAGAAACCEQCSQKPGLSLQLYSVRNDCKENFDRALARVAKMGFEAVEFAGYHSYSHNAKGLRARLDDLGLKVAGTHIGTSTLVGDSLAQTIEFHQEIGCQYLVVPGDKRFWQPEGSKELADIFNLAAAQLKKYDMYTGYHNHTHEFEEYEGKTYWELFAERTLRDVVLQQDVGWTTAAKRDPVQYIRAYPYRSQIIHCKPTVVGDQGRPILGEDSVKWQPIFQACVEVGDTKWYTIEQERYLKGKSPMECVEMSLEGMRKILA